MSTQNPIICAIDTPDLSKAKKLAAELKPHVGAIKLGLEFFVANGAAGVREVAACGTPIFLDLKFHDIPNTVAGAIKSLAGLDVFMTTIHTNGSEPMMRAAADAAKTLSKKPLVVGVTVLTSMDEGDIKSIGVSGSVPDQVKRLATLAQKSRLDGVVCSAHEIALIREACGRDFVLVVPGIRPEGSDAGDQKRIMTPKEAMDAGATYLVIGRPITGAENPAKAAQAIYSSLQ